jgi:3-oxoacyl-[acyl-carrier protein] reductase
LRKGSLASLLLGYRSFWVETIAFIVNMISPGWIPVERHEKEPQSEKAAYRALIPGDRWGVPEDLAGAVIFLASGEASFITGQNLCINGGLTVS